MKKPAQHLIAEVSRKRGKVRPASYLPHQHPAEPVRLPLLVESQAGYRNLCRLITRFKLRESTKAEGASLACDLEEFGEGLVCLTGGQEGPLASALVNRGYDAAQQSVEQLVGIFGQKNVYVEVQRHFDCEEEHRNRAAIRIARTLNLPVLATGGVNYATEFEREILDVFTCIRNKTTLDRAGRLLSKNTERYLGSAEEMRQLFYDYPEVVIAWIKGWKGCGLLRSQSSLLLVLRVCVCWVQLQARDFIRHVQVTTHAEVDRLVE